MVEKNIQKLFNDILSAPTQSGDAPEPEYLLNSVPAIKQLYFARSDDRTSGLNKFPSRSFKAATDEYEEAYHQLKAALSQDTQLMNWFEQLENANDEMQSELCGAAFTEGVRSMGQLLAEMLE